MATPLDPAPPKRRYRRTDFSSRARAAVGAGIGTLALAAAIVAAPGTALAQDDQLTSDNAWVTDQIKAPGAWETTKGEGVTVAVIDTGMSEHPFFEGKSVERGYSVFSEEEDAWNDEDGHGTAVAAMVLSVAPEATILPVRDGTGADPASDGLTGGAGGENEVEAIRWAVDNGADVLAMPWVVIGSEPREEFLEVIQYAIDKGVVVVAGTGNDPDLEPIPYPASIPGVVAVAGTDESGGPWSGSTTGPEVVVAAPSSAMTVPVAQEEELGWGDDTDQELYHAREGTSLGTGIVGGAVALVLAGNPELDGNNAIQRLIQTAGDGSGSNRTDALGYGLIDVDQAVNAEDIETVEENPLGYPMGEPGTSGEGTDEEASGGAEGGSEEPAEAAPSASAAEKSGTGLSTIIIVAAAVVLVGAAIAVWLVLRGRSRKQAVESGQPGGFGGEQPPVQGGYPQTGPNPPQYGPPPGGGQNFSPPPSTGGPQQYSPPMNRGESSPPWGPGGDPNQGR
ncbi:S8 family serine peptidase [Glycomyces arizonensis]|uniref:S8 family serine peptidase n=1 Tax=Glycomyces arizonensis TaxID=256035 RepID=UPI0009FD454F|nr:S8 family serine peptidase [Glycomyces arizonensis]